MSAEFTTEQREQISRAFSAGNYANAYEGTDIEAFEETLDDMQAHERSAFILGFFSSYTLDEIGSDRELFDDAYWSDAGQYIVKVAGYCDDRAEEYSAESED